MKRLKLAIRVLRGRPLYEVSPEMLEDAKAIRSYIAKRLVEGFDDEANGLRYVVEGET